MRRLSLNSKLLPRDRCEFAAQGTLGMLKRTMIVAALATTIGSWSMPVSAAGVAGDQLYQGLLHVPLENIPSSQPVKIADFPLPADAKSGGAIGAVRITFPAGDPRAQITYYVFDTSGNAITYNNRHLGLPPRTGKLLAYPPMAQCDNIASGGYCDMIVQDNATVITTSTSAPTDQGSGPMIALAFQHLTRVLNVSYRPPAPPVVGGVSPCGLATPAEVAAALGAAAGAPQTDRVGGCSWMSARGSVSVQPKDGGRQQFEFDRMRTQNAQPVTGIGDAAFAFQSLAGFVQINILKGNRYVVVIVQSQAPGDHMQAARALAASIAARL